MSPRRAIRGVLQSFLGTYTSRNADFDGYWLFGFLINDLGELQIDLLTPKVTDSCNTLDVALRSAVGKFEDQMRKAGLERSQVREAWLTIRRLPERAEGSVNGQLCEGYNLSFLAGAVTDCGRRYEIQNIVFVAPHNPEIELRRGRIK